MNETCYICKQEKYTENLCYDCYVVLNALHNKYTTYQLMILFSHILGLKMVEDIVKQTSEQLEAEYWAEYTKDLKPNDIQ